MSEINYTFGNYLAEGQIITSLNNGDKNGLAAIFNIYQLPIQYFASLCLQGIPDSEQKVEEIVAASFIKLWKERTDFSTLEAIKVSLYSTARDECLALLRVIYQDDDQDSMIQAKIVKAEFAYKLWQQIEQLPELGRQVFTMSYFENFNIFEIARILNVSVDTVRIQKAKAFFKLKAIVGKKRL